MIKKEPFGFENQKYQIIHLSKQEIKSKDYTRLLSELKKNKRVVCDIESNEDCEKELLLLINVSRSIFGFKKCFIWYECFKHTEENGEYIIQPMCCECKNSCDVKTRNVNNPIDVEMKFLFYKYVNDLVKICIKTYPRKPVELKTDFKKYFDGGVEYRSPYYGIYEFY